MTAYPPQGAGGGGGLGEGNPASYTTNTTISTSGYYDNTGASGTVLFTAGSTGGIEFLVTRLATQQVDLAPASGKQIYWSGSFMAVDEKLEIHSDRGYIRGFVDHNGHVHVIGNDGDIREETP